LGFLNDVPNKTSKRALFDSWVDGLQVIRRRRPEIRTQEMDSLFRGRDCDYLLCRNERIRSSAARGRNYGKLMCFSLPINSRL